MFDNISPAKYALSQTTVADAASNAAADVSNEVIPKINLWRFTFPFFYLRLELSIGQSQSTYYTYIQSLKWVPRNQWSVMSQNQSASLIMHA